MKIDINFNEIICLKNVHFPHKLLQKTMVLKSSDPYNWYFKFYGFKLLNL